jgi:protein SCO1/2
MWQTSGDEIDLPPEIARILGEPVVLPTKKPTSLYARERTWINQRGEKIKISSFKGQAVVVTFIYTRCFRECLLTIIDLKRLDKLLSPTEKSEVQYLLFSFDPEHDTPEALKKYAVQFDVDLKRWNFLTANHDELDSLAREFDFYYKKDGDYFSHTVQVNILRGDGTVQKRFYGNNLDANLVALELRSIL